MNRNNITITIIGILTDSILITMLLKITQLEIKMISQKTQSQNTKIIFLSRQVNTDQSLISKHVIKPDHKHINM